jgi:hypothetical protein
MHSEEEIPNTLSKIRKAQVQAELDLEYFEQRSKQADIDYDIAVRQCHRLELQRERLIDVYMQLTARATDLGLNWFYNVNYYDFFDAVGFPDPEAPLQTWRAAYDDIMVAYPKPKKPN